MTFEPDARATAFVGCETYEGFLKNGVPEIYLKPEVHDDVKSSFRVVEKLLQYSYYEYEFFDVAGTKSLLTLELALKLRYVDLNKGEGKHRNLNYLIQWFLERKYFETTNPKFLENIRWIRNHLAHPDRYSFGGFAMRQWIEHSLDLINSLYENVELRIKRASLQKSLLPRFRRLTKNGAVLTHKEI